MMNNLQNYNIIDIEDDHVFPDTVLEIIVMNIKLWQVENSLISLNDWPNEFRLSIYWREGRG